MERHELAPLPLGWRSSLTLAARLLPSPRPWLICLGVYCTSIAYPSFAYVCIIAPLTCLHVHYCPTRLLVCALLPPPPLLACALPLPLLLYTSTALPPLPLAYLIITASLFP